MSRLSEKNRKKKSILDDDVGIWETKKEIKKWKAEQGRRLAKHSIRIF